MESTLKPFTRTRFWIAVGATLLSSACQPSNHLEVQLLQSGVASPKGSQSRTESPGSPTGFVTRGDIEFIGATTSIPATRGAAFGLAWRLTGLRKGQSLRVTQVITHPPMTKPDGTTLTEQVSYEDLIGDGGPIEGKFWYFLREEYEVVRGPWLVSLSFSPTLKLEQKFTLAAQ